MEKDNNIFITESDTAKRRELNLVCEFGTHCHEATNTVFFMDRCEHCNGVVQEPNAIGITNTRKIAPDFIYVDEQPPEIWHDDDLGYSVCDDCHGAPERKYKRAED
tara:strand:- start:1061 stop:1378 length:318 start_codon:yes stop_codon:yes gene_type:complete